MSGKIRSLGPFDPGSSFCEALPLVMNLGCTRLKLSPAEALNVRTANAAHVLVLDAPDWRHLAYHLGGYRFAAKIKSGRMLA